MQKGFHQIQKQTQVFTSQFGQSLEILQVSALELRDIILEELQSNPVLEELSMESDTLGSNGDQVNFSERELDFKEKHNFIQKFDENRDTHFDEQSFLNEDNERRQFFLDSITIEKSLQEHILDQAKLSECNSDQLRALEFLVGSLDDRGFLITSIDEIEKISGIPKHTLKSALDILKYFDPIGIGSKDVQDCLLTQLNAMGKQNSMAAHIIKEHYPLLLRRRIPELSKKLSITFEKVQAILDEIGALDPHPGRKFQENNNRILTPDAIIEKIDYNWTISLNLEHIPRLRLSKTYKDFIAKGNLSLKEKEYIQEKISSGKFILNAIEQRQKTLKRITETIFTFQKDFFEKGPSFLHPLTLNEVGTYLNLHETTVSRGIANKYLKTPHGLFPYKYFFTSGYNINEENAGISNTSIKQAIAKIIQAEPANKPLSDQKIVEILTKKNIQIARRTVAKYREEMGILSTSLRRKY